MKTLVIILSVLVLLIFGILGLLGIIGLLNDTSVAMYGTNKYDLYGV